MSLTREERFIMKGESWSVRLHGNQGYLGRCLVWSLRDDADHIDMLDITTEEREELFLILKQLKRAAAETFSPDLFNYAFLGNTLPRHLHGHFIPRYANERVFAGETFTDERWTQNYLTDDTFIVSDDVMKQIVDAYRHGIAA